MMAPLHWHVETFPTTSDKLWAKTKRITQKHLSTITVRVTHLMLKMLKIK